MLKFIWNIPLTLNTGLRVLEKSQIGVPWLPAGAAAASPNPQTKGKGLNWSGQMQ